MIRLPFRNCTHQLLKSPLRQTKLRRPQTESIDQREMLQFPALMRQWPSPPLIPASTLLPVPATSQEDELLLAMAESDLEDKLNEIRKTNSHLVIIGKPTGDTKEEYDAEVEDDDADNVEESDGDDFDQETG